MATYVIGDVQGCYEELRRLLDQLRFDEDEDRLWFTGDLVNRGPESLKVLRFVRKLGERAVVVLGNHDLHLVAAAVAGHKKPKDTFDDVLKAKDRDELIQWIRTRKLAHAEDGWLLVHAGVPPQWSVNQTLMCAQEAEQQIASPKADEFFSGKMYGDRPDRWDDGLKGWDRLRFIINCFTRLRYCTQDGRVDFGHKSAPQDAPKHLVPWFAAPDRDTAATPILFGHWSTLGKVHWPRHNVYGLDTGCIWGGPLTALRLDDHKLISVRSSHERQAAKAE